MARCEAYQNIKDFRIPCKVPIEQLKRQYSGLLTINDTGPFRGDELELSRVAGDLDEGGDDDDDHRHNQNELHKPEVFRGEPTAEEEVGDENVEHDDADDDDNNNNSNNKSNTRQTDHNGRRTNSISPPPQLAGQQEEPQFKVPMPRDTQLATTRSRTAKSLKRKTVSDALSESTAAASYPLAPVERPAENTRLTAKPGVVASAVAHSTTGGQQVANKRKNGKAQPAKSDLVMINTGGFVDETIISFATEFCQRANVSPVPRDPLELCEKFHLIIADCRIAEFDDHYRDLVSADD